MIKVHLRAYNTFMSSAVGSNCVQPSDDIKAPQARLHLFHISKNKCKSCTKLFNFSQIGLGNLVLIDNPNRNEIEPLYRR